MHALILAAVLALSGCVTLMASGPDRVPVWTDPPGADVLVNSVLVGQTPTMVTLDRHHKSVVIRIEMPGFAPIAIVPVRRSSWWVWGDLGLLTFAPIGLLIDFITGEWNTFDDSPITVRLTRSTTPVRGSRPRGHVPPPSSAQPGAMFPGRILRQRPVIVPLGPRTANPGG